MATRQVKLGNYIAYGANDFLGAGAMSIIGIWVVFFYTTYCGLTVGEAGLIVVAARLLDAIFSPLIGYISDHFHHTWLGKKFGRRRFFILISIPLLPSFGIGLHSSPTAKTPSTEDSSLTAKILCSISGSANKQSDSATPSCPASFVCAESHGLTASSERSATYQFGAASKPKETAGAAL